MKTLAKILHASVALLLNLIAMVILFVLRTEVQIYIDGGLYPFWQFAGIVLILVLTFIIVTIVSILSWMFLLTKNNEGK